MCLMYNSCHATAPYARSCGQALDLAHNSALSTTSPATHGNVPLSKGRDPCTETRTVYARVLFCSSRPGHASISHSMTGHPQSRVHRFVHPHQHHHHHHHHHNHVHDEHMNDRFQLTFDTRHPSSTPHHAIHIHIYVTSRHVTPRTD